MEWRLYFKTFYGITGFISFEEKKKNLRDIAIQMSKNTDRGPDDEDIWVDLIGSCIGTQTFINCWLSKAGRQTRFQNVGDFVSFSMVRFITIFP